MFVRVSSQGRKAKLHLEGPELVLDFQNGLKEKVGLDQAKEMINLAFEVQKVRALEILQSPVGTSLIMVQPAFKDVSMEMERLASALDEVILRTRASNVRLAPESAVQQSTVVEMAPKREPVYQRNMKREEQPVTVAKSTSKKRQGIVI